MKRRITCPVCGKYQFREECDYDICEYCGWENEDYFDEGGANKLSLSEYKLRYEMYLTINPNYIWKHHGYPELTVKERCKYLHIYSSENKSDVAESKNCGCFFCIKIFDSTQVCAYINDKGGQTALCPHCSVDAILPDNKVDLSIGLLEDMYRVWFE